LVSLLNRFGIFYGWWVVFAAASIVFLSAGTFFYGFSLLVGPLTDEFGWSRASISIGFSLRTELGGIAAPVVGFAVDRMGVRRITLVGVFIVAAGLLMMSRMESLLFFYVAVIVIAIGMSGTGGATASTVISHWFRRQRGRALGFMTLGGGAGGLFAIVFAWLINDFGWRDALVIIAVMDLVLCVPLALTIHNRPADLGLEPDGQPLDLTPAGISGNAVRVAPAGPEITTADALRSTLFWRMALVFGLSNFATTAVIVHQVPFLEEQVGFSETAAAASVTIMIAISIVGRLGFGGAADRYSAPLVMAIGLGFTATGLLLLSVITEPWQAIFPLFFFGIGFGSAIPLRSVLQAEYFGLRAFGAIQGLILTVTTVFAFVGPVMAGFMYDATESYRLAFLVLACGPAIGIPLVLTLRAPRAVVEEPATA
jgi:sugar phosphate permease